MLLLLAAAAAARLLRGRLRLRRSPGSGAPESAVVKSASTTTSAAAATTFAGGGGTEREGKEARRWGGRKELGLDLGRAAEGRAEGGEARRSRRSAAARWEREAARRRARGRRVGEEILFPSLPRGLHLKPRARVGCFALAQCLYPIKPHKI